VPKVGQYQGDATVKSRISPCSPSCAQVISKKRASGPHETKKAYLLLVR
jgi:hypothetical protein